MGLRSRVQEMTNVLYRVAEVNRLGGENLFAVFGGDHEPIVAGPAPCGQHIVRLVFVGGERNVRALLTQML